MNLLLRGFNIVWFIYIYKLSKSSHNDKLDNFCSIPRFEWEWNLWTTLSSKRNLRTTGTVTWERLYQLPGAVVHAGASRLCPFTSSSPWRQRIALHPLCCHLRFLAGIPAFERWLYRHYTGREALPLSFLYHISRLYIWKKKHGYCYA